MSASFGWLERVVSAEQVLTADVRRLVDAVAARYAGTGPTWCGWRFRRAMRRSNSTWPLNWRR